MIVPCLFATRYIIRRYDIPSALHQQLQDYMPPSSNYKTHFNLLYTVYSIPNVILPLFGCNVVDRHGAPLCLTIFATLVFSGAALLSVGMDGHVLGTIRVRPGRRVAVRGAIDHHQRVVRREGGGICHGDQIIGVAAGEHLE